MVPDSITFSNLFKVMIIQRQIRHLLPSPPNANYQLQECLRWFTLALPRPPWETARDVRVKCVHKTHFSDAFHQCIGTIGRTPARTAIQLIIVFFLTIGPKVLGIAYSFRNTKVPLERKFQGVEVLGTFAPEERTFHGTKVLRGRKIEHSVQPNHLGSFVLHNFQLFTRCPIEIPVLF